MSRAYSSGAGNGKIPCWQALSTLAGLRSAQKATGPPSTFGVILNDSQSGWRLTGMALIRALQVTRCHQPVDVEIEKFLVDRRESYSAAAERPRRTDAVVGREDVLEVHLRHRQPGFSAEVDEERDEGGHRVGRVLRGISQQLVDPFVVRYGRHGEAVTAQPVNQGSEERVFRAGEVIGAPGRFDMRGNMPDGCRAYIGGYKIEAQGDIRRHARIRDKSYQRAHFCSGVPGACAVISDNVQGPVDGHRQARAPGVPEKFLGHELSLYVAHAKVIGISQRRVLGYFAHPHGAEACEHGRGGYIVNRYSAVKTGEAY